MPNPAKGPPHDPEGLVAAADQAIAACGGNAREAVKALIVANEFLERKSRTDAGCVTRIRARQIQNLYGLGSWPRSRIT
jgi:hypothetical protein